MSCDKVGSANADIAGLGIILSFVIQAGFSFFLTFWLIYTEVRRRRWTKNREPNDTQPRVTDSVRGNRKARHLSFQSNAISRVLMKISEIQSFNGIALLIGALVRHSSLDLYHSRIIYDTVSFTGISAAPALVTTFEPSNMGLLRALLVLIFLFLYLIFSGVVGAGLRLWDDEAGRCFVTDNISMQGARHPDVDIVYLTFTTSYFCTVMIDSLLSALGGMAGRWQRKSTRSREVRRDHTPDLPPSVLSWVPRDVDMNEASGFLFFRPNIRIMYSFSALIGAILQYPVHVYMVFALRASNESHLSGGSENEWGFGQIVALIMIGSIAFEGIGAAVEYKARILEDDRSEPGRIWRQILSIYRERLANEQEPSRSEANVEEGRDLEQAPVTEK